jgi:uncharacterized protein YecT (DUF1311 family)
MPVRPLPKIALALVTVLACTSPDRRAAKDTSAPRAGADTTSMTTHQMIEALERDRSASDRDMTATEDSVYVFMGDSIAALLKQAHASWEQYRKAECDAIRVAFSEGSMAPVAHLECWVDLTDDHRKFMAAEYGYMRNGGMPPAPGPR